jgi:hypothetical protein
LRAAELHPLGMIGIGAVYELYVAGTIDGDDEVAVTHLDAADGYRATSVALVDIRRHTRDACAAGVLSRPDAAAIIAAGRALSYEDRDYPRILRDAGVSVPRFLEYVRTHAVSAKREDARALVRTLADIQDASASPMGRGGPTLRTMWHVRNRERRVGGRDARGVRVSEWIVLLLLRITGRDYPTWHAEVALAEIVRSAGGDHEPLVEAFSARYGLDGAALNRWLDERFLTAADLQACLERRHAAEGDLCVSVAEHAIRKGVWGLAGPPPEICRQWLTSAEHEQLSEAEQAARIAVRAFAFPHHRHPVTPFLQELKMCGAFAAARREVLARRPIWDESAAPAAIFAWCAECWGLDEVTELDALDRGLSLKALAANAAPFHARAARSGPFAPIDLPLWPPDGGVRHSAFTREPDHEPRDR